MDKYIIDKLYLENFRGFSKPTEISFGSRLTLLFGKGSVGKSTIIDAINCLAESHRTDNDLSGINTSHILSKLNNTKEFTLGFGAYSQTDTEEDEDLPPFLRKQNQYSEWHDRPPSRVIKKRYAMDKSGFFYPKSIDLYSLSDNPNKFVTLFNTVIPEKVTVPSKINPKRHFLSKVSFIENEYAWKELYTYTYTWAEKLIQNLERCQDFAERYASLNKKKQAELSKKIPEKKILRTIDRERDDMFEQGVNPSGFTPYKFIFGSYTAIQKHINFLKKGKIPLTDFMKYIADDMKQRKTYLYKNNQLFGKSEIREEIGSEFYPKAGRKPSKRQHIIDLIFDLDSFAEFLTLCLSDFCGIDEFPSKTHFVWTKDHPGKTLTAKGMFKACYSTFSSTLSRIKTIRHAETFHKLINTIIQGAGSGGKISHDVHNLIEENQKEINKWLAQFDYDFKVAVERIGLSDETEIVHRKNKFKIPANQGGSGADYLLTFLSECIAAKNNILLLEEPEKALHAKMQVELSKFFVEKSKSNQLIIETHSENLLLGVLKQIRDKKISHTDVKIIYVYMENGQSKIDELSINEKGAFQSRWRHGFFTEKLDLI